MMLKRVFWSNFFCFLQLNFACSLRGRAEVPWVFFLSFFPSKTPQTCLGGATEAAYIPFQASPGAPGSATSNAGCTDTRGPTSLYPGNSTTPKGAHEGPPRGPQGAPKWPQRGPRRAPEGPPKGPQGRLKGPQRTPQGPSRCPQEAAEGFINGALKGFCRVPKRGPQKTK